MVHPAATEPLDRGVAQILTREILGPLNDIEQKHAPDVLYIAGDRSLLKRGPRVSVVGSRQATEAELERARSLARALVENDIVVVSGLAAGIDTVAHLTAVEAGGKTIAVLGTPLDEFYPKQNEALQRRLMVDQLVVSQFPRGFPVTPKSFPIRNRTMALLTDATVIVEAGENSGTLHQGWEALRLGRLLFLMENVVRNPQLSWPAKMVEHGAQVLSRGNLDAFLQNVPALTVAASLAAEA